MNITEQQKLTSVGLTYINTCRSYIQTSRDFTKGTSLARRLRWCISTVMFTCVAQRLVDSSDFRLLGKQSSLKWEIPALDADEPPCKIWLRLLCPQQRNP